MFFFFFKQKTAYEMRISDWSSDVVLFRSLHAAGPGVAAAPDIHLRTLAALDSVNFAPGADWSYNNGAYALLTEIVTRVSGRPFADFLRERLFEPVGMTDTMLRPIDTDLVPNSATLHVPSPAGGFVRGVFGVPLGGRSEDSRVGER